MSAPEASTRLFLLRHGAVAESWRERLYGHLDVPLSPLGERQAREGASRLAGVSLAAVVSSGLARAEATAALLREGRSLARRDEPDLAEMHRGEWAGLRFDELEARWPGAWREWRADPARRRPPGGESLEDVARRSIPLVERLAREHAGSSVAIVGHTWVLRTLVCHVLALDLGATLALHLSPGALVVVDWPAPSAAGGLSHPTLAGFALADLPDPSPWTRGPPRPR